MADKRRTVFVWEYVCSGACPDSQLADDLIHEGRAMLMAVLHDVDRLPDRRPITVWDSRVAGIAKAELTPDSIVDPGDETSAFLRLADQSAQALLIGPEIGGCLTHRIGVIESCSTDSCGSDSRAAAIASDKLRTAEVLKAAGVPTPTTIDASQDAGQVPYPRIIKPRDGAGSWGIRRLPSPASWDNWRRNSAPDGLVVQREVHGRPLSAACLIGRSGIDVWPLTEQVLGRTDFAYLGGRLPVAVPKTVQERAVSVLRAACEAMPGLRGYVGFDLIWDDSRDELSVVDINPRLTTSYLGYRQLTDDNLARWLLDAPAESPRWFSDVSIEFAPTDR